MTQARKFTKQKIVIEERNST